MAAAYKMSLGTNLWFQVGERKARGQAERKWEQYESKQGGDADPHIWPPLERVSPESHHKAF